MAATQRTKTDARVWATDALGATVLPGGVRFAVWAPKAERVDVRIEGVDVDVDVDVDAGGAADHPLDRRADGVHAGIVPGIGAGARYRFRLDGGAAYPDPRSRFQPEGVHGPSEAIDPTTFAWSDAAWPGLTMDGLVIYELHVGAYTPEGTFAALVPELPEIKRLGVTAIELMPVAEFPGRWNWGYDGVDLFAPSRAYGRPDDLRRLVDAAHQAGLGVILDVVYNHLGPDGNYLRLFSDDYFTDRHHTPWGEAVNFDGPRNRRVRDFVIDNARSWVQEYHVDGLRLDATHAIVDDSPLHLLEELADGVRAAAVPRTAIVIAEDERNEVRLVQPPAEGGYELDAVWADDFHHAVWVALTGERGHYFAGYEGTAAEIATTVGEGFLYQGQVALHRGAAKGTPVTDEPARSFVFCLQNHDQVGNRAHGERLRHLVDPAAADAAAALLLLAPETPLLWMGEEFAASAPFLYFTDHEPDLGKLVTEGRTREFAGLGGKPGHSIPDPQAEATFRASKLDLAERETNAATYRLNRDLLALRRDDSVLRDQDRTRMRATAVGERVVAVHRWRGADHRLLLANLGDTAEIDLGDHIFAGAVSGSVVAAAGAPSPPSPLSLARERGSLPASADNSTANRGNDQSVAEWTLRFSTADRRYDGSAEPVRLEREDAGWRVRLPARTAVLLGGTAV